MLTDLVARVRAESVSAALVRAPRARTAHPLVALIPLLGCACCWIVLHPYYGLWHDGELYTLQALAHLRPQLYASDLFLRFGSQDRFSIFGALQGEVVSLLGPEHAAAASTFLSQLAFLCAAGLLAARVLPRELRWLAIALLIAVPADYGAGHTFRYIEEFVTPRMGAESLVVLGLATMSVGRMGRTCLCLAGALVLHPVMALGGIAMVGYERFGWRHPRTLALIAVIACGALALAGLDPGTASLRFDAAWLDIVQRKHYLFVSEWSIADWASIAVPLATLAVGALMLEASRARSLCVAALLIGAGGIALTAYGADWLELVAVAQVQPWRALWIADFLAVLLLPLIFLRSWGAGRIGKAITLLLASMWVVRGESYALAIAALALLVALSAKAADDRAERLGTHLLAGAAVLCLMTAMWALADVRLYAQIAAGGDLGNVLIAAARMLGAQGPFAALAVIAVWWAARSRLALAHRPVVAAIAVSSLIALAPLAWNEWTGVVFTSATYRAFAGWRRLIPPGSEVYWPTSPLACWLLLERPNYLSSEQSGSDLYSRRAALELDRRARVMRSITAKAFDWTGISSPAWSVPSLATVCAKSDTRFIVTGYDLGAPALAKVPAGVTANFHKLRLYRCGP
ncbi:MAG TPA: hypothetical protein VMU67_07240 [Steroidobacteraceae bacterium]|nr:hypothetical protein [Steroidobacteraceae bacterium]